MRKGALIVAAGWGAKASMGPQHESCGKYEYKMRGWGRCKASMGPQHESCGKSATAG